MQARNLSLTACLVFCAIFSVIVPAIGGDAEKLKESPVRFAVIGDRTGGHEPGIYGQIIQEIELLKPDFVMTVGDMIEGYTDDYEKVAAEWAEYKPLVEPLTSPIYYTPGNHDIWDDQSLEIYREEIGDNYYSFNYKGLHFVILDVSRIDSDKDFPEDQAAWLEKDLKEHEGADYTFVFYHKPFWYYTLAVGSSDRMHDIFRKHKVDAVFCGHTHRYFSNEYDNITYTCVGSSGGGSTPAPTGLHYHFVWVTVDDRGISIAVIKKDSVLPWDEYKPLELRTIDEWKSRGLTFDEGIPAAEGAEIRGVTTWLKVRNPSAGISFSDTLRWKTPGNWTVEPEWLPVDLPADSENEYEFEVNNEGLLYPLPEVSLVCKYKEGRGLSVTRTLRLTRETFCHRVKKAPVIDGRVEEACWVDPVTHFCSPDGCVMQTDSVSFYFAYDKRKLYLAAICNDEDISALVADTKKQDGAVYNEDCIGYFLQPDREVNEMYQIYFNGNGTPFDQKISVNDKGKLDVKRDWNGEYEIGVHRGENFWSIEASIPWDQLGDRVKSGDRWGINFRRKQKRLDTSADWQLPISYDPSLLGVLKIE